MRVVALGEGGSVVMKLRKTAFLEITTDLDSWDVPKEYKALAEPHTTGEPTVLYVPWPLSLVPQTGSRIWLHEFADHDMRVKEVEYYYRPHKKLLTVYVKMDRNDQKSFGFVRWPWQPKPTVNSKTENPLPTFSGRRACQLRSMR
jgi:hypothetical protein